MQKAIYTQICSIQKAFSGANIINISKLTRNQSEKSFICCVLDANNSLNSIKITENKAYFVLLCSRLFVILRHQQNRLIALWQQESGLEDS